MRWSKGATQGSVIVGENGYGAPSNQLNGPFGKDYALPPMTIFVCACFAKTSIIWIPILYAHTSTHFQLSFFNQDSLDEPIGSTRVGATLLTNVSMFSRKNNEMPMNTTISKKIHA
ncbi:unnamed protein product [Rotaria sp. Silwood1]|nr:unnamed protein product [Rotaria sp. Silwood1]